MPLSSPFFLYHLLTPYSLRKPRVLLPVCCCLWLFLVASNTSLAAAAAASSSWCGAVVVARGTQTEENLGGRVSISQTGDVVAVGSFYYDGAAGRDTGLVQVWERRQDGGGQYIPKGSNGRVEGENVDDILQANALSGDGSILAVGAAGYDEDRAFSRGLVRVYDFIVDDNGGDRWQPRPAALVGLASNHDFGSSVALSGDGSVLAVGAPGGASSSTNRAGQVRVFEWSATGNAWIPKGDPIEGTDREEFFGETISLSQSGNTLAVGATDRGTRKIDNVRVFSYTSEGGWEPLGRNLVGDEDDDDFGSSVSLSSDGLTLAIGAPKADPNGFWSGLVQVFWLDENSRDWTLLDELSGDDTFDAFGKSVSLSGDASRLVVGATQGGISGGSGFIRLFEREAANRTWGRLGDDVFGESDYDNFGYAVAMSRDGSTVIGGAPAFGGDGMGYATVVSLDETCPTPAPSSTPSQAPTDTATEAPTYTPTQAPTASLTGNSNPTASGPTGSGVPRAVPTTEQALTEVASVSPAISPPSASPMSSPTYAAICGIVSLVLVSLIH